MFWKPVTFVLDYLQLNLVLIGAQEFSGFVFQQEVRLYHCLAYHHFKAEAPLSMSI